MIPFIRQKFNAAFTAEKYKKYISYFEQDFPKSIDFRIAETPIFIDSLFKKKLIETGDYITQFVLQANFQQITNGALEHQAIAANETSYPECIVIDYAIAMNEQGELMPALIELQGFPSLFAFESIQNKAIRQAYDIPEGYNCYLNGIEEASYLDFLKKILTGKDKKHTVLLEIFPHEQKTRIDFYYTRKLIGIPIVCISEIYLKGRTLCYSRDGIEHKIERIYNRVVWDDLKNQSEIIKAKGSLLLQDIDIEWVTHPNHFYRISKYLLPFLNHSFIPEAYLVSNLESIPLDLENYVLKPLFSFAGKGVMIDITPDDISSIKEPRNWILQRKVNYAPIIKTPTGPAKAEIRIFYFYDEATHTYVATNNLTRLSKGKMIGVNYNNTATWVGGSISYFEVDD